MKKVAEAMIDIAVHASLTVVACLELVLAIVVGLWFLPDWVAEKWREYERRTENASEGGESS